MADGIKSILITGAASGIGRATAILFSRNGWFVGLYDVNAKSLATLRGEIGGKNCCSGIMDVSNPASVRKGVRQFSRATGGTMDILFNNAGVITMGSLESISARDESRIIDVNLKGMLNCIRESLDLLKAAGGSRIINMSSASSLYGTAHLAVYSATKSAVSSLTESLNLEFRKYRIFVSDVRAPYVRTPLLDKDVRAPSIDSLGVKLEPEDVAQVVWKASRSKKIHNNTKGIRQLLFLLKFPDFVKQPLIRYLLLPK